MKRLIFMMAVLVSCLSINIASAQSPAAYQAKQAHERHLRHEKHARERRLRRLKAEREARLYRETHH